VLISLYPVEGSSTRDEVLDKETNATQMQIRKSTFSGEKQDPPRLTASMFQETPVTGNLGKEPRRLRKARGRRSAHLTSSFCRRQGPGSGPQTPTLTTLDLTRTHSGLDLETSDVQQCSPPATCGHPNCGYYTVKCQIHARPGERGTNPGVEDKVPRPSKLLKCPVHLGPASFTRP
jgi:hypothetical protein